MDILKFFLGIQLSISKLMLQHVITQLQNTCLSGHIIKRARYLFKCWVDCGVHDDEHDDEDDCELQQVQAASTTLAWGVRLTRSYTVVSFPVALVMRERMVTEVMTL